MSSKCLSLAMASSYEQHKSRGESKELFMLNHMCSVIRHDLSRMARQSWVNTKRKERLQGHLDMYLGFANGYIGLIKEKREHSIQEIKQLCAAQYGYNPKDYTKKFRIFAKTLPLWMQDKIRKYRINSFMQFTQRFLNANER
jgi:hypothetical protein